MKKNKKIKNRRRVYYQPCFPLVSLLSFLTDIQQTVDSTRCIRVEQSHQWRNVCAVMKLNGKLCDLSYVEYDTRSLTNTNDSCLHRPYSLFQKILANNERAITSNI